MVVEYLGWLWTGWKEGRYIRPVLNSLVRARDFLRKPKRGILILGSGGVGKSTLKKLLQGDFDYHLNVPGDYIESTGIESGVLREDQRLPVTALPGQERRRATSWSDVLDEVAAGKYAGIIVVVANGYHSMGDTNINRHRSYQEGDSVESFVNRLVADRRKDELKVLTELEAYICKNIRPVWVLTFVSKQDLWFGDQDEVEDYYRTGAYSKSIVKLGKKKNDSQWRTELLFGSLVIAPFVAGRKKDVLKKNEPGYGHREQVESVQRLKEMVTSLLEWNGKK